MKYPSKVFSSILILLTVKSKIFRFPARRVNLGERKIAEKRC